MTLGVTSGGTMTALPMPTHAYRFSVGQSTIVPGPDGNLWFTESAADTLGQLQLAQSPISRMSPAGVITEAPMPLSVGSTSIASR
jgi:hypothetical protein